jgi:hypothetical protein
MRRKREAVLPFAWNNDHLPKVVREDREKYKRISRLLDENPDILEQVHEDLKKLSEGGRRGRRADFTRRRSCGRGGACDGRAVAAGNGDPDCR